MNEAPTAGRQHRAGPNERSSPPLEKGVAADVALLERCEPLGVAETARVEAPDGAAHPAPGRVVLVAFASRHGSTREVAEAISLRLKERGFDVQLQPAREVRGSIAECAMVVLGAPIYSGRWHRDAQRFLKRHRAELIGVAVAVFGMGPRDPSEEHWQRSRNQLDRALSKRPWLNPVAVAVFGGVDPPQAREPHRDLRDWDAIRAWADRLLGPGPPA